MARRTLESAKDYYGNEIRVGDWIVCISNGVTKAIVERIEEGSQRYNRPERYIQLIIRQLDKDGTMFEHTSKQKDSESTVKINEN
jgi:RNA binding exosome subunit